jgi:putative aldouronate transport system permease protein
MKKQKLSGEQILRQLKNNWQLYVLFSVPLIYFIVFCYYPMYGIITAFQDFSFIRGFSGSEYVGVKNFYDVFKSAYFTPALRNTLIMRFGIILTVKPLAVIVAVMINNVGPRFKKTVQTITYMPHFISLVVVVGMLQLFLSPSSGVINTLLGFFGVKPINFLATPSMFYGIYVVSDIWQSLGWSTIIYLAALTGISPELHEAAMVDGANLLKRIWHIELPGIIPTVIITTILSIGQMMSLGFDKVYLMQKDINISASETIATLSYRMGILNGEYSFSSAVGLFNSVVNCILLVSVNALSRKITQESLW